MNIRSAEDKAILRNKEIDAILRILGSNPNAKKKDKDGISSILMFDELSFSITPEYHFCGKIISTS